MNNNVALCAKILIFKLIFFSLLTYGAELMNFHVMQTHVTFNSKQQVFIIISSFLCLVLQYKYSFAEINLKFTL